MMSLRTRVGHVRNVYVLTANNHIDSVSFLIGFVSWLLALFSFIIDEIFTLADYLEEIEAEPGNITNLLSQKGRSLYPHLYHVQTLNIS